jgi:hypothetical protein
MNILSEYGLIELENWLGNDGIDFFENILKKHGTLNVILDYLHPVHLREGMQVRNFLRDLPECKEWSAIQLDDNWQEIVKEVIKKHHAN